MVINKEDAGKFVDIDFMQDISRAYQSNQFAGIAFVLSDGLVIETNSFVLAWRSDYFASMLFGGAVVRKWLYSAIHRHLGSYSILYGKGNFSLNMNLLESARMMCLDRLVGGIGEFMKYQLEFDEVEFGESLMLLEFCVSNKFEEFEKLVLGFVSLNLATLTSHEKFSKLSAAAIMSILKYENFFEIDVFNALASWIKCQVPPVVATSTKTEIFRFVDLVSISSNNLMKAVRKSGFYEDKAICDAIEEHVEMENVNVCLEDNGAQVVYGMAKHEGSCIRGSPHEYSFQTGYTFNVLYERITVKFKREYMINKVEFLLWDLDDRYYDYILESSLDGVNWTTILDCTMMDCESTQTIFFPTKAMKFISVKGTRNTHNQDDDHNDHFQIVKILATLDTTDSVKKNSGMVDW